MDKLKGLRKMALVALAALAIVLAVGAPSQAKGSGGHGFGGGHPGGGAVHHGFDGHHFDGRHFDRHHPSTAASGSGLARSTLITATTLQPTGTRLLPTGITARATGRTIRTWRVARRRGCPYRLHKRRQPRHFRRSQDGQPARRRKISPTYHERMIWGQEDGSGLRAVESKVGRIGQLAASIRSSAPGSLATSEQSATSGSWSLRASSSARPPGWIPISRRKS